MKTRISLFIGSIHSVIVGGYHFALPDLWDWKNNLGSLPESIEWALFALNFLFSFQLCACGFLAIWVLVQKKESESFPRLFLFYLTTFWLIDFIYQIIRPFPLPEQYKILGILLPALAFATFLLMAIPLTLAVNTKSHIHEKI